MVHVACVGSVTIADRASVRRPFLHRAAELATLNQLPDGGETSSANISLVCPFIAFPPCEPRGQADVICGRNRNRARALTREMQVWPRRGEQPADAQVRGRALATARRGYLRCAGRSGHPRFG